MKYELIALDLDDTLLNSEKKITPRAKAAVVAARQAGVRVVIATGRAYGSLLQFSDQLGGRDYAISLAGGMVTDPAGRVIIGQYLPPEVTWMLMNWAVCRGIYFQVYTEKGFSYPRRTGFTEMYEKGGGFAGHLEPDLPSRLDLMAGKLLLICDESLADEYRSALESDFPALLVEKSAPFFVEISTREASKGNALRQLAARLGVPREKVMAIGDSEIDRSMVEWAGTGVAMANAIPEVIRLADHVAPSCDEDGVARVLEELVLDD